MLNYTKSRYAGKRSLVLFVILFTFVFSYSAIAQEMGSIKSGRGITIPEKNQKLVLDPLPAGTYSVGSGGYFPTIDSAFNKLSIDGISGEVILELTDNLYRAPSDSFGFFLNGPIPGAGPTSRVTIRPAENKNVTIEGFGFDVFFFTNTSYLTIDGISVTGSTTLTIHVTENIIYGWNDCLVFSNNSDHNIVQNIIFISDDYNGYGCGVSIFTGTDNSATADSNLIQNNFIKKAGMAIYLSAYNATLRAAGNTIKGNILGSETDSLINWGIQIEHCQNTIVEGNIVQNIKAVKTIGEIITIGINSFWGYGDIIRNNVVHGVKSRTGYSSVGILLSGSGGWYGIENIVYNNMIYDIQSVSTQADSRVAGIQLWSQYNTGIYYNTVYLSGIGANHFGSGALYIWNTCTNVDSKNNILVNTRDESQYCASAIQIRGHNNILTKSNHNDLYYEANPYNCLVESVGGSYYTLEEWQETGQDYNSVTEMPHFIDPYLHIDESIPTYLEGGSTTIAGIQTDFDGDLRHAALPDIGADEFEGIQPVGIEEETLLPTEFVLEQNYPNPFNPGTTIKYSIPKTSKVTLTLFNLLGEQVTMLVNEEKNVGIYSIEFNASNLPDGKAGLPSGVYFYQLKATPDGGQAGSFVKTKKMILLR